MAVLRSGVGGQRRVLSSMLLLTVVLCCGYLVSSVQGIHLTHNVHMIVTNDLDGTMNLHCKSKDTDLGEKTLLFGQEYSWDFHPNIWATTLFWCKIGYVEDNVWYYAAFNIYEEKGFGKGDFFCGTGRICRWFARSNGVYYLDELVYSWQKN